jgi:pimeloyl-ACP methyl ester carboxylesterase
MPAPEFLSCPPARSIAYHRLRASGDGTGRPGVVFLGGFASDMTGTKATWLEGWARARGRAYLRFDYTGHGQSSGRFMDGCIGDWARDAADALGRLTEGPQVLVGSSMGGWIALLLAKRHPERLAGLVGIAAAPDFTEDLVWQDLTEEERDKIVTEGNISVPSDYGEPMVLTHRLFADGRENMVLRSPLPVPCPVRLLQGTADLDVPVATAIRLIEHIDCADARLTLVKGADHRFSGEAELALLGQTLDAIA